MSGNMASIVILIFFTVFCTSAVNAGFINVLCKAENIGHYGQTSLVDCVVETTKEVSTPVIRYVTWMKDDVQLLHYGEGKTELQPGYSFAVPSWSKTNMNVSLLISNTGLKDEGVFTCTVLTTSGHKEVSTILTVTATYNKPTIRTIPQSVDQNIDRTLECTSDGGYPAGQLRWFDVDNKEWTDSAVMETKKTIDGRFQLSSRLSLLKNSVFSKYTCVVFNASGGKGDEETIILDPPNSDRRGNDEEKVDSATKVVAPLVVIGSLIVGLLLLAVMRFRRRAQLARRQSAAPLMGAHRDIVYESPQEEVPPVEKGTECQDMV